jgi:hypothetical protein
MNWILYPLALVGLCTVLFITAAFLFGRGSDDDSCDF